MKAMTTLFLGGKTNCRPGYKHFSSTKATFYYRAVY